MSDPQQPEGFDPTRQAGPTGPPPSGYPPYPDPAYAGQVPPYGTGYPPPYTPNPAEQPPQQWMPGQPPTGGPDEGGEGGPPEPPRSHRWLLLAAGAAVLLVVGLVIALVIANGTSKKSATISRIPASPATTGPTRSPTTTTRSPSTTTTSPTTTSPGESTTSAAPQTIVYSVTGEGRAISIAYMDTGGVLQTEFNVELPWSKEVSLTPPTTEAASVTVVNIGQQITCSLTVDGARVRQRTGSILTVCSAVG